MDHCPSLFFTVIESALFLFVFSAPASLSPSLRTARELCALPTLPRKSPLCAAAPTPTAGTPLSVSPIALRRHADGIADAVCARYLDAKESWISWVLSKTTSIKGQGSHDHPSSNLGIALDGATWLHAQPSPVSVGSPAARRLPSAQEFQGELRVIGQGAFSYRDIRQGSLGILESLFRSFRHCSFSLY